MHFNIYIDDNLGKRLENATQKSAKSRNALIREAIDMWLNAQEKTCWPQEVLDFKGIEDFPPFESYRDELQEPGDDPLA